MSESLRKLVDNYIDRSDANTFLPNVDENEKAMYVDNTKTALYEQIVGEVKSEVMDEVTKEAELRIEKKAEIKRLDELKRLFYDGFIIAICVGLFVNQATKIIECAINHTPWNPTTATIILAVLLLYVCRLFFQHQFTKELIEFVNKEKSDENNRGKS